jgi:hypothetical protein
MMMTTLPMSRIQCSDNSEDEDISVNPDADNFYPLPEVDVGEDADANAGDDNDDNDDEIDADTDTDDNRDKEETMAKGDLRTTNSDYACLNCHWFWHYCGRNALAAMSTLVAFAKPSYEVFSLSKLSLTVVGKPHCRELAVTQISIHHRNCPYLLSHQDDNCCVWHCLDYICRKNERKVPSSGG